MTDNKILSICPKCGSAMGDVITTKTGRMHQCCSTSRWDSAAKANVGCDFVNWLETHSHQLDETCPNAGHLMAFTKFGKKNEEMFNRWLG